MTKTFGQSFILFLAVAIVSVMFMGMEAKADESVRTNFFFEEGECRGLDGRSKRLCLLHCEFLECDERESLNLGPFFSRFHERACNRLLDSYEEESGAPGPPCFCGEACEQKRLDCVDECSETTDNPEDFNCCSIMCGNDASSCGASCCFQNNAIKFNICIEDCQDDPDPVACEEDCQIGGCGISFQGCPIIVEPPPVPE